jgi:hypothetical protein
MIIHNSRLNNRVTDKTWKGTSITDSSGFPLSVSSDNFMLSQAVALAKIAASLLSSQ